MCKTYARFVSTSYWKQPKSQINRRMNGLQDIHIPKYNAPTRINHLQVPETVQVILRKNVEWKSHTQKKTYDKVVLQKFQTREKLNGGEEGRAVVSCGNRWVDNTRGFLGPHGVIFIDVGSGHTSVHLVTTTSSHTVTTAAIICMYVMVNKKVYKK